MGSMNKEKNLWFLIKLGYIISAALALFVIFSWVFFPAVIEYLFTPEANTKFNTALCFLLLSTYYFMLMQLPNKTTIVRGVLNGAVFLFSVYTLTEHLSESLMEIDNKLLEDNFSSIYSGRMSLATCLSFILLCLCNFLFDYSKWPSKTKVTNILLLFIICMALLSLGSIAIGQKNLNLPLIFHSYSWLTSIMFLSLGILTSSLFVYPKLSALVYSPYIGSTFFKLHVPFIIVIPILFLNLILYYFNKGVINIQVGLVAFAVSFFAVSIIYSFIMSRMLNLKDGEQQQANDSLRKSKAELENYIYVASHDLSAPISNCEMLISEIKKDENNQLSETSQEYLNYLAVNGSRIKMLLEDLIDFTQLDTSLVISSVNITQIISDFLKSNNISKDHYIIGQIPNLKVNKEQFSMVIKHLLGNSIKYQNKIEPLKIEVSYKAKNGKHYLSFVDNGIGINPKHREKIFEIFKRLHTQEEYQGTGMGLALVKKIIENHNGKIWLNSTRKKGAEFIITLPIK